MHRIDHGRQILRERAQATAYTTHTKLYATIAAAALILSAVQF